MDLEDFIATTLTSIKRGISKANSNSDGTFAIYQQQKVVSFDLAVEVSNEKSSGKGGGLRIQVVEGKLESSSKDKSASTSRIHFIVDIKRNID